MSLLRGLKPLSAGAERLAGGNGLQEKLEETPGPPDLTSVRGKEVLLLSIWKLSIKRIIQMFRFPSHRDVKGSIQSKVCVSPATLY